MLDNKCLMKSFKEWFLWWTGNKCATGFWYVPLESISV